MHRAGWLTATSGSRVAAAVVVAALTGCTMCPDPHDYSGPVPNGSSPQNDFRARSNGILPLGATPRPWPLLVDSTPARSSGRKTTVAREPRRHGEPTLAEPLPEGEVAVQAEVGEVETASVLVAAEDVLVVVPDTADEPAEDSLKPLDDVVAAIDEPLVPPPSAGEPGEPLEVPSTEMPGLAETPGWRSRRQ